MTSKEYDEDIEKPNHFSIPCYFFLIHSVKFLLFSFFFSKIVMEWISPNENVRKVLLHV